MRPDAVVVFLRERERLAVVGLGLLGLGLALPGEAAARVGAGQPGIDADRRGVVGDGAVEVALLAQLDRAVVVDAGELGPAEAAGLDRLRAGRDRGLACLREAPLAAVVGAHQSERGNSQRAGRDQRRRTQRNPFHRTRPGNASASCRTPARRCAELVNLLLSRRTINQSLTLCFAREWTCVVMARHR